MKLFALFASAFAFFASTFFAATEESWTQNDFTDVSNPASPYVAYALRQNPGGLSVVIEAAQLQGSSANRIDLGIQAARKVILSQKNAAITRKDAITRYTFTIPSGALVTKAADWNKLRMTFTVAWPGGPYGTDRQRERFLFCKPYATFDPVSSDPDDWQPIDLKEHAASVENRKKRILVDFDQPVDGKASIVIEDSQGHRVRNLISGKPLTIGKHRIEWDGLDEQGNVVTSGTYRWRAVSHPGITPHYLFSFYNHGRPPWRNGTPSSNWLADHSNPVAATTYGDRVYLGAPIAESGHNIVQLNLAGEKTGHVSFPTMVGIGKLFLAADADCFYAIMEGSTTYEQPAVLPDGHWQLRRPLNVLRWTTDGNPKPYKGPRGEKVITQNLFTGTGSQPKKNMKLPAPDNLAGAALLNGMLYISLKQENRIVRMDVTNGDILGEIALPNPGLLATDGKGLLIALSGTSLVRIEPGTYRITPLFAPKLSPLPETGSPEVEFYGFIGANPTGMAVNEAGEIFLSDNGVDQDIKVFDFHGRLLRQIGKTGGRPLNGPWDSKGVYQPHGIAVDRKNQLWITETDTFPRRNSVWDAGTGALVQEIFGPSFYGADLCSFDSADHTRWVAAGEQWKLDFDKKTATPVSTLYHQTKAGQLQSSMMGKYWNFYHHDGRTFLISYGEGQSIYELRADGSLKLWAFCASLSSIAQNPRWTLPKAITDLPAVQELFAKNAAKAKPPVDTTLTPFGPWKDKVSLNESLLREIGILWVDRNGDDLGQPEEFDVLPAGYVFQTGGWGVGNPTLDLKIPATRDGKEILLTFSPDGFLPSGAPNYNMGKALASAVPLDPGIFSGEASMTQDRYGREIISGSPMKGVDSSGHTIWTFPNDWIGVHGSHESPLPETGVMQGTLYFLGTAPLDSNAEVFVMNGNHGRFFVLTTDGFYLDEMFKDVRVTQTADAYLIGGEPFGGFFGRGEDGRYYLQSGHTDYRIFRIDGLDQIKRSQGTIEVGPAQIIAAQANTETRAAKVRQPKFATVEEGTDRKPGDDPNTWPGDWSIKWGNPQQPFPYVTVKTLRFGESLYLAYRVKDPSPWVNHGTDWTMLFKTGDSVDFQFSTDPGARPDRPGPVPGDRRLLIAPFQDRSIAVLYSYREPGTKSPIGFSSPWRTENVDRVTEIKSAKILVQQGEGTYTVIVSVPLAELGLPQAGQSAELLGDFGVIYGDNAGSMDLLRSYWSNQATGLVNDVPGEIMISPRLWGTLKFSKATTQ